MSTIKVLEGRRVATEASRRPEDGGTLISPEALTLAAGSATVGLPEDEVFPENGTASPRAALGIALGFVGHMTRD